MTEIDEKVCLVEHCPHWASQAAAESVRIAQALGMMSNAIQHIGSTAISGLVAKPIIDLMLGVETYPSSELQPVLKSLGYECFGEADVPGRTYFRLRNTINFNVHLVLKNGEHWKNNIAFREYLRSNETARLKYTEAKQRALSSGADMLLSYSEAKAGLVGSLMQEAIAKNGSR